MRIKYSHNFKTLKDSNRDRYCELMDMCSNVTGSFKYIQENDFDIEIYARE